MADEINDIAFIQGDKVYLRAFRNGDEEMIARIENHPLPRKTLFYAFPTSPGQQLEKTMKQIADSNTIVFTICRNLDDEPIGQTAFFRIDWVGRMAVFYIGIADAVNRSKGFGSEACRMMVDYAFNTLNLNRIQLHVAIENTAAVKTYQTCGFVIEGELREAMFHEGRYCNFYVMGLLRSDWSMVGFAGS
jgi:RimJ/RimL family protein N-acetyltransferase